MRIHFIGIGGIGVSALARYYLAKGNTVTGSDVVESEVTEALKEKGAHIQIGPHREENIPTNANLVIYSPAIARTNPERQRAERLQTHRSGLSRVDLLSKFRPQKQIRTLSYPEALGEITKEYFVIAVAGTHGKSTTTAMISLILERAGFDPTVIVGTKLKEFGDANFRMGYGSYLHKGRPILVIEADEHTASFLQYFPDLVVLTSIEPDHLDFYKNLQNVIQGFRSFVDRLPKDGILVANRDDKNIARLAATTKHWTQYYSASWEAAKKLRTILQIPGEFNVTNAHAALTAARVLGVPDKQSFKALEEFQGTWRRFEIFNIKTPSPYTLVSDYGHHPTEVRVTVEAAREKWPNKKIWLVFQPHQYQRTFYFYRDFVSILSRLPIDKLIMSDIYDVTGRETKEISEKVSSEKIIKEIKKRKGRDEAEDMLWLPTQDDIYTYIQETVEGEEIVIVMGAGDIYDLTLRLRKLQ